MRKIRNPPFRVDTKVVFFCGADVILTHVTKVKKKGQFRIKGIKEWFTPYEPFPHGAADWYADEWHGEPAPGSIWMFPVAVRLRNKAAMKEARAVMARAKLRKQFESIQIGKVPFMNFRDEVTAEHIKALDAALRPFTGLAA